MKKIYLFFIFLLPLLINAQEPEELLLLKNEQIIYKQIPITLKGIGLYGSIAIEVGNVKDTIALEEEKAIYDLNIKLLETTSESAKIQVSYDVECLINEDCNDNQPCTENICTGLRECALKKTQGCPNDDACLPLGSINNESFCNEGFEWEKRKPFNALCTSNYECLSNQCKENYCTRPKGVDKMSLVWLVTGLGMLIAIKGALLFFQTARMKNIIREFSLARQNTIKFFGIALIILGTILMIVALT